MRVSPQQKIKENNSKIFVLPLKLTAFKCLSLFMTTFITSLTQDEFKAQLKDSIREVLVEQMASKNINPPLQYPARMDLKTCAEYLHLSPQTIYSKTSLREIPHIKKGKRLYFERDALDSWLLEGKKQTVKESNAETDEYLANGSKRKR